MKAFDWKHALTLCGSILLNAAVLWLLAALHRPNLG